MEMSDLEDSIELGDKLQWLRENMEVAVAQPSLATASWYSDLLLLKLVELLAKGHKHEKLIHGVVDVWARDAKERRRQPGS